MVVPCGQPQGWPDLRPGIANPHGIHLPIRISNRLNEVYAMSNALYGEHSLSAHGTAPA